jgi:TPP-dependent pyruvate/acetoin dehydrogenase alpha subunit
MTQDHELYRALYTIRRFDQTVLDEFASGVFYGTTHTYLGQEANAVGVISQLDKNDIVFSNHRCHGHFLAYGGQARALFAELMGKPSGVCGGRGGSQHIHWRNFFSNGIQGSTMPIATGVSLAEKYQQTGAVVTTFIGDGTLGEGTVYESLNMAALWGAPILYVLENNRIAQTTLVEMAVAGDITARFTAFDIPAVELDTSDVLEIQRTAGELLADVRAEQTPRALILHTYRFGPHSKGDDTRPPEEVNKLKTKRDPLAIHATRLEKAERSEIETEVDTLIAKAFSQAKAAPQAVST